MDFTDDNAPTFGSVGPSEVGKLAPSDEAEVMPRCRFRDGGQTA